MADAQLQIGEVARLASVSIRTVRFYEEEGLLAPSTHTSSGIRLYSIRDVNRLILIRRLKLLGLTIEDIRMCMAPTRQSGNKRERVARTLNLLYIQKEKAQEEAARLANMQQEIDASIEKVKTCSTCSAPRCSEECPSYGQVL